MKRRLNNSLFLVPFLNRRGPKNAISGEHGADGNDDKDDVINDGRNEFSGSDDPHNDNADDIHAKWRRNSGNRRQEYEDGEKTSLPQRCIFFPLFFLFRLLFVLRGVPAVDFTPSILLERFRHFHSIRS